MSTPPADRHASTAKQWGIPFAVVGAIVTAIIVGSVIGSSGDDAPSEPQEAAPVQDSVVTVLYEVEGSTDYADVTMETPDGTEQISPDVPMVRKGDGRPGLEMEFASGDFLYLSAQNNRRHGTVTCRITVDGRVVSENTASGGYAIATCKGSA